jgi:hypothetical protein
VRVCERHRYLPSNFIECSLLLTPWAVYFPCSAARVRAQVAEGSVLANLGQHQAQSTSAAHPQQRSGASISATTASAPTSVLPTLVSAGDSDGAVSTAASLGEGSASSTGSSTDAATTPAPTASRGKKGSKCRTICCNELRAGAQCIPLPATFVSGALVACLECVTEYDVLAETAIFKTFVEKDIFSDEVMGWPGEYEAITQIISGFEKSLKSWTRVRRTSRNAKSVNLALEEIDRAKYLISVHRADGEMLGAKRQKFRGAEWFSGIDDFIDNVNGNLRCCSVKASSPGRCDLSRAIEILYTAYKRSGRNIPDWTGKIVPLQLQSLSPALRIDEFQSVMIDTRLSVPERALRLREFCAICKISTRCDDIPFHKELEKLDHIILAVAVSNVRPNSRTAYAVIPGGAGPPGFRHDCTAIPPNSLICQLCVEEGLDQLTRYICGHPRSLIATAVEHYRTDREHGGANYGSTEETDSVASDPVDGDSDNDDMDGLAPISRKLNPIFLSLKETLSQEETISRYLEVALPSCPSGTLFVDELLEQLKLADILPGWANSNISQYLRDVIVKKITDVYDDVHFVGEGKPQGRQNLNSHNLSGGAIVYLGPRVYTSNGKIHENLF